MRFKIKIIEISGDLKSKSLNIRWFKIKIKNDFKITILILKSKSCPSLLICQKYFIFTCIKLLQFSYSLRGDALKFTQTENLMFSVVSVHSPRYQSTNTETNIRENLSTIEVLCVFIYNKLSQWNYQFWIE